MTQAYAKEKKMRTKKLYLFKKLASFLKVVSFLMKKIGQDPVVTCGNPWKPLGTLENPWEPLRHCKELKCFFFSFLFHKIGPNVQGRLQRSASEMKSSVISNKKDVKKGLKSLFSSSQNFTKHLGSRDCHCNLIRKLLKLVIIFIVNIICT